MEGVVLLSSTIISVFMVQFSACVAMYLNNFTNQSSLLALKAHITLDPHHVLAGNWSTKPPSMSG